MILNISGNTVTMRHMLVRPSTANLKCCSRAPEARACRRLIKHARIERVLHTTYAEPFVGMGGAFLRRQWIPRCEVINDVSREVSMLFRILQRHYPQFQCIQMAPR